MRATAVLWIGLLIGGCSGGGGGGPMCQMEGGACTVGPDCCGQLNCVGGFCTSSPPGCKSLNFICLVEKDCCSPFHCVNNMCSTMAPPDMAMQTGAACDLIAQNCSDANQSKCAAVDNGSGTNYLTGKCVAPSGSKMTGETCTRPDVNEAGAGFDDCAKGNFCSAAAPDTNPANRRCRKLCSADADCASNERCDRDFDGSQDEHFNGICVPTCASPLSSGACPNGLTCAAILYDTDGVSEFFDCRAVGTGKEHDHCTSDASCAAGMGCLGNGCVFFCNTGTSAPCRIDQSCSASGLNLKPAVGICL